MPKRVVYHAAKIKNQTNFSITFKLMDNWHSRIITLRGGYEIPISYKLPIPRTAKPFQVVIGWDYIPGDGANAVTLMTRALNFWDTYDSNGGISHCFQLVYDGRLRRTVITLAGG